MDRRDTSEPRRSSFPLAELIKTVERGERFRLMTFEHGEPKEIYTAYVDFFELRRPKLGEEQKVEYRMQIKIANASSDLGTIRGFLIQEQTGYVLASTVNYGVDDQRVPHVPGLVGETIYQLLDKKIVVMCYSSATQLLTNDGGAMFQRLEKRPELDVVLTRETFDGEERWIVKLRTSLSPA